MANTNRNKHRMKRWISITALSAMVWTGTVWSGAPASAAASNPFTDVVQGHWAEKHITKLFYQNVISGTGDGKFNPSGNISRQDAVIVALGFMGLKDSVNRNTSVAFPSYFEMKDYAKAYVYEAFNRGLITKDEEFDLAMSESGKSWGESPASREWVVKLMIRAIGKETEALANTGKNTTFSDNDKIDPALLPYVVTAVNLGLVSGMTATTFEPKAPINRASLVTLFSLAEPQVNVVYAGQVSGVLIKADASKLTLLHDDGTQHDYTLAASAMFASHNSNTPIAATALKPYSKVILIHDDNGNIGYVEQADDQSYISTVEGKFSKVDPIAGKLWLADDSGFQSFSYDPTNPPAATDAEGSTVALEDIPDGASVSLSVDTVRTDKRVFSVKVNQVLLNKNGGGIVVSWNAATGALRLSDPATGTPEDLTVPEGAAFKLVDEEIAHDKLLVGDSVTYEIKNSVLTTITIAKRLFTTVNGTLVDVNQSAKIASFQVEGKLTSYYISDNPAVTIDGMASASLSDLQKNDLVTVTLDVNEKVTKIAVNNRSVQYWTGATIAGYVAQSKTLSIIDAGGVPHNYILNSSVRYDSDGLSITFDQAVSRFTSGKKISIAYSGDNAVTIYFVAKYVGTVLENNTTAKTLKLQVNANQVVTLSYQFPYIDAYGTSTSSYADIKAGDQVTATLNDNQDQVVKIQLRKTAQLEIVSVDALNKKVRVKQAGATTTEDWIVPASIPVQNEAGATITLGQLLPGMFANFTFEDRLTLSKIKVVTITYGQVMSVNLSAATLEIGLPGGKSVTKSVGFTPQVFKNGAQTNTLASVSAGDRVEVRTAEDGQTVIEIVAPINKTFWKYDATAKAILVKKINVNDDNTFKLENDTYIHNGASNLIASQLKDGDLLAIYVLRGKVVEVSKIG